MAEDPGLKATPSGSIDPGHGHVLQDENEEEAQRCPVFIQQVHIVAARGPCRNKAAQEHTHTDPHWRKTTDLGQGQNPSSAG